MTDRFKLNETRSPIDPSSWGELNQNWEFIKSYLRFLQRQLDLISGKDAQEIMDRLDAVITDAENATLDAIEAKQAVDRALVELNALMERAATAAQRAETAADEGNRINTVLSALQLELETLQTNLNTIVQSEAQRIVNEEARVIAEGKRADAEATRQNNETTRETNEQARIQSSANATSAANTAAGRAEDAADAAIIATTEATDATNAAITATNEANVATAGTIQAKTAAEDATAVSIAQTEAAQTATLNANTAADRANEYANEAEFQAFQAENATVEAQDATRAANTAIENANNATSNANTAADRANTATTNADTAANAANAAATEAEYQAFQAEDAAQKANVIASNLEGYNMPTVPFSLEATYIKHQHVSSDGSTYQAKVETQGNPLPVFPATSNEWFTLVARKGDKGEMGTGLKPLGKKNNASELPLTDNEPGDSYLVGINLYIWDGEGWIDGGPVQGPQGEQGVQGETGVGLQYTWDGTQLGVKRADEATFTYTQLKGEKGDQGEKGDPGANGSDANVTNENVINALGFTPANDTNLAEVDQRLTQQLAQRVLKNEVIVNVKDFGAKGDYNLATGVGTDDTTAIQNALNFARNASGITVYFPPGRYKITKALTVTTSFMKIVGEGFATEIVYDGAIYNSTTNPGGIAVLNIGFNDSTLQRIIIRNISFNGNNKTLWAVQARITPGIRFEGVRFKRGAGHLYAYHAYQLHTSDCVFEYNISKKPSDMTQADWNIVKTSGIISLVECHNFSIGEHMTYAAGHDEDNPLFSVYHISNCTTGYIKNAVIERDAQYLAGTQADDRISVNHIIYTANTVRTITIDTIYAEHLNALSLFTSVTPSNVNIRIKGIYMNLSSYYYYPFYIQEGSNISIDAVHVWGTYIKTDVLAFVSDANRMNPIISEVQWYKGKKGGVHNRITLANGKTYADTESDDSGLCITNGSVVSDGHKFIRVMAGLTVTSGSDSIGKYIAVESGRIANHEGKLVNVGVVLSNGTSVGWILRPRLSADKTYNVCVDMYGGVWVEETTLAKSNNTGKAILATFATDVDRNITSLSSITNVHKGTYVNDAANKLIYTTGIPTSGIWTKGDRILNVAGIAGGVSGWVCTTGGNPGVWKSYGIIEV